jgi:hypothetical protein
MLSLSLDPGAGPACRIDQPKRWRNRGAASTGGVPCIVRSGQWSRTRHRSRTPRKKIGADAISVVGLLLATATVGADQHKMVDKGVGLPMLLYNNPGTRAIDPAGHDGETQGGGAEYLRRKRCIEPGPGHELPARVVAGVYHLHSGTQMPGMLVGVARSITAERRLPCRNRRSADRTIWAKDYDRARKYGFCSWRRRSAGADPAVWETRHAGRPAPRGLAVKSIRWPTKPLSAEHQKLYEENMTYSTAGRADAVPRKKSGLNHPRPCPLPGRGEGAGRDLSRRRRRKCFDYGASV